MCVCIFIYPACDTFSRSTSGRIYSPDINLEKKNLAEIGGICIQIFGFSVLNIDLMIIDRLLVMVYGPIIVENYNFEHTFKVDALPLFHRQQLSTYYTYNEKLINPSGLRKFERL